ncbi:MAG: NAD(P)(+) transhydrogenase (Re/Si-specific) subunit beta [Phycisphaerae bacterium]
MGEFLIRMLYIVAALMFYFGLKMMSSPKTARKGNIIGALGMLLAVIITLFEVQAGITIILAGLVVGGLIGAIAAKRVEMTQMPELVALFNGSGGAASALVAAAEFWTKDRSLFPADTALTIGLSVLIGLITLFGSLVAFGKLSGKKIGKIRLGNPITFPGQHAANLALLLAAAGMCVWMTMNPLTQIPLILLILIATALGVLLTIPIGGADMPVVVSLLNSYSGIAAAATGFVLNNQGLIVAGSLVGASGLILTQIMCKAMNRSLLNVLAGGFGQEAAGPGGAQGAGDQTVRQMDSEEAAMVLEAAQNVVIVPGYGMAVAQAQHSVAELASLLKGKGINVKYGIHPVAGRMPGHMNVLLAEANVPYEQLFDLELNGEMEQCDAVLVIGANDVVNPAARDDPSSQIYGMPIFNVDKAKTVMVCKRSLNPGFAGIENQLFFLPNTVMLFGDAKATIVGINSALKES